ncbi:uncharacterized protein LOC122972505 isoform X2 [Scomber scombrus]|uniref:Uncharacterized protein LOC122972505 isoform X2 n=1 Tax=Scomber scombrus TaxID=13677 RepID=A0AAV1N874_SCOSC
MDNNEISPDESGTFSLHIDIPKVINPVIWAYLDEITWDQWELLATNYINISTINWLSSMCLDVVEAISSHVLDQYRTAIYYLVSNDTMVNATEMHCHVTEDDIQDTIGDSLVLCFAAWMQVWEKRSQYSDKLLELVTKEVTKRVNHSLAANIRSPSTAQFDICQVLLSDLVYHTSQILYRCFWRAKQVDLDYDCFDFSSTEDEESSAEFSGSDEVTDEEFGTEDGESTGCSLHISVLCRFSGPDKVNNIEIFSTEDGESNCSSFDSSVPSFHAIEESPSPAVEATKRASTFEKNIRSFFGRKSAKVTPASEVVENGSTVLPPKKKRHTITRIFSSLAKILRSQNN